MLNILTTFISCKYP